MNRLRSTLIVTGRVLLGLLFAYSGFSKLIRPSEYFEFAISMYEIFPPSAVWLASVTVPWVELIFGAYLLLGFEMQRAAAILASLTVMFQLLLGQALLRGLRIDECGCFGGGFVHLTLYQSFALDSAMLLVLLQLSSAKSGRFSLDRCLSKPS